MKMANLLSWLVVATCLLSSPPPAWAQINWQRTQQEAQKKINNAGETQQQTQQTIDTNMNVSKGVQAIGTIVSVQGELIVLNQVVQVEGQTVTVKNKFYLQKSTLQPPDFKIVPRARVKITFVNSSDGKRMIADIRP